MYIMCLSKGLNAVRSAVDEDVLPNRTLGFIPTAGETYENPYFIADSRERLRLSGVTTVEFDVTADDTDSLIAKLTEVDGVFVAGGNSFHLLKQLKEKKLFSVLRQHVLDGMPYFGESAGAVILYSSIEVAKPIDDPQDVPDFTDYDALDLVKFFVLPHIDREKYRPLFTKFYEENRYQHEIVRLRDDQALLTRDGISYEIIESAILDV